MISNQVINWIVDWIILVAWFINQIVDEIILVARIVGWIILVLSYNLKEIIIRMV
jgi:hypothetical protein